MAATLQDQEQYPQDVIAVIAEFSLPKTMQDSYQLSICASPRYTSSTPGDQTSSILSIVYLHFSQIYFLNIGRTDFLLTHQSTKISTSAELKARSAQMLDVLPLLAGSPIKILVKSLQAWVKKGPQANACSKTPQRIG